jgi:serine beta-lactamase-like protein LACTB, mitochondrial
MWLFVTKEPLHPNPQAIPSVMQTHPPPQWDAAVGQARQAIQASMTGQSLPAVSVAVGSATAVIWSEAFGWADIETRTPATPQTRFRIGTASTALTSAAVGVLLEKGRLKLDDEIQAYVPQFPKKQPGPLTLRHLMAHTGGVRAEDAGTDGPLFRQRCEHPLEALPHFASASLLFEPGTQYQRSNYGWILVSAAVQAAGQRPFHAFMKEEVFQPLKMDATGAESATEENPERIGEPEEDPPLFKGVHHMILKPFGIGAKSTGSSTSVPTYYGLGFGNDPQVRYGLHVTRSRNVSCYAGALAFLSTPADVVRFGLAISGGHGLLQAGTVAMLRESQKLTAGRGETGHGLGWDLATRPAPAMVSHGEWVGEKVASVIILRDAGLVIAVTTNASHADTPDIATKVAEAFVRTPKI